jgi:hypothetical protein
MPGRRLRCPCRSMVGACHRFAAHASTRRTPPELATS